ncbi:hypothetical protein ASPZODRAFT_156001 [Penicilliopsis zonata CBS 506.65]|uniref:Cullin family profile domain-containing protein n=1 Tax=Penicilliopsis zonata CBS 506.65 TaxID=1073090 RepID=A0A1L9SV73_9EURO|nr:hypothetical protein ASPZODRAFT_156001 [Penicilliopsis zonata CBS 506.65]OJJ51011.1 hypothetical protein ASPZODRAFT_156001 [Penicilliopsis zonata CBS 506.65]
MEDTEALGGLRGLYQDLCALSDPSLVNIERLCIELEAQIQDFRKLLDKPTKNNTSRQALLSGKLTVDDVEFSINEEFQQQALQLADALDLDELQAALLLFGAQEEAQKLDRTPVITAIMQFHQRRHFLLDCLRLIFQESFELERDRTQALMQEVVAQVLEIQNGLRNASLFARKAMSAMEDVERWLTLLNEQVQKASIVGQLGDADVMEAIEFQRSSLEEQHQALGGIVHYLFKGTYTSPEDLRVLLNRLRKLDRFDMLLVHYIPATIASFIQHGSPEGTETKSLHSTIMTAKDPQAWVLPSFHAMVIALWLAVYSGLFLDGPPSFCPPGIDLEKEAEMRSKQFMGALDDGGLDFMLAVCSGVNNEQWGDPARKELVALLLRDTVPLAEPKSCSDYFKALLMVNFEVFTESCIANMPDTIRLLKSEEDSQRLEQITALRDGLTSTVHRGFLESRTHLESFLMVMAFSFEHRQDAAQEFWADSDGNLYGFLQWASKRQTVPRVSAFCEMLCCISEGDENAVAAHRFLSEEDKFMSGKFKRSASMNWTQMFAELQLYASKVTEKPSTSHTMLHARKPEPADMSEPESPVMLTCYLRLMGHLSKQSRTIRNWMLQHPTFNIVGTLLTLCSGPIPTHLRATTFMTLAALMTDRTSAHGNEMWLSIDQWISGGLMSTSGIGKVPIVPNTPVWHEQQAFQKIGSSFDQANAFVALIHELASPSSDQAGLALLLPFPESLGSSYRMPGIEPYIDFVLGHALARKLSDLNEVQTRQLTYNCLSFVVTCLRSFNENLVTLLSQSSASPDASSKSSTLTTYIRLHPFGRAAEWLFNEDVIKAIFATAHQNVDEINRASPESTLVLSLLKSIETMNLIIDLQATYLHIVRPVLKSQAAGSKTSVANASLASFEDNVLTHLTIIPQLGLYCGSSHQQLVVESMSLLEKLSSSRKLNKMSSPELSRWQSSNKIVEVLSSEIDVDSVARPLVNHMQPDLRELESGPQAPGYIIRESLFALLTSCLGMITDRPNVAHVLLGFSSVGSVLDVGSDGLFANRMSLLHAVIGFLQSYPDGMDGSILPWMVHLKRMAFEVLQDLWSSKLSATFTLSEMRAGRFLFSMFTSQQLIKPSTLWNGLSILSGDFWASDSASALAEFLLYRSHLYGYATTEIRAASKIGSPTLQAEILSILLGTSSLESGETIRNPTVFDLIDFADMDLGIDFQPPSPNFLSGVNIDACAKPQADASLVLYNLDEYDELVQVTREELLSKGQLRPQDEELFLAEAEDIKVFLLATNQSRQALFNRYVALRSWTELVTAIVTSSAIDDSNKTPFIHHSIQIILPKLEVAISEDRPEGLELARLAETLISNLEPPSSTTQASRSGDIIDEKLYQLFQICMRGVVLATSNVHLRETLYNISVQYISRITSSDSTQEVSKKHSQQVIKSSGPILIETICDDAYVGQETCRVSALLLLNLLAILDSQEDLVLADSISQSNYLALFLDAIRTLPDELSDAQANDTELLLSYYESLLSLLQRLSQTKSGATCVLKAGLFQAVRDSRLFAADPDIGIEIDNPDALRRYYDLLLSVIRVIVSAVFVRGIHNEQMLEQTRGFLAENRQSMVGVFKRFARVGAGATAEKSETLDELVKSYMALIAATDFLENSRGATEQRSGKRKSIGKRKLSDHGESSQQQPQQQTISELLSSHGPGYAHSTTSKRARRSSPPARSSTQALIAPDKMYNFSNSEPKASGAFGQSNPLGFGGNASAAKPRPSHPTARQSNFTPHTGPKRLVVKNLRTTPRLNQDSYFEKVWAQLDAALTAVFAGGNLAVSLEELYKGAENVCRQGRAAILAGKLQDRCRGYVSGTLHDALLARAGDGSAIDTLRGVVDAWTSWHTRLVTVRWIFYYLDQSFLLHSKELPVIREMGLVQFRSFIFSDQSLKTPILQGACDLIGADRQGDSSSLVDSSLLRKAIDLFHELDVYSSDFEPLFLTESKKFFCSWADKEAAGYLATFAENSHHLIEREMNRCELFSLNRSTKQKISELLDEIIVVEQEDVLLDETDVLGLLRAHNQLALERLYSLLERRESGVKLRTAFNKYIVEEGTSIVFDHERQQEMVTRLLQFKQQLDDTWNDSFHRNDDLGHVLRESFETFMNKVLKTNGQTETARTGEMIAKYVDMLLKGGWKVLPGRNTEDIALADEDAEINRQLDKVLDLFRFVHGKAVFEAFYKNDLARRLLMGRSASDDAEKSMLTRLRTECGSSFTHNLESMFKDMDVARDEMSAYKSMHGSRRLKPDLNVSVLSASAWPTYPDVPVRIPPVIATALGDFETFYNNKYNGRKLSWKHQLAHCQIQAKFPKGNKNLVVSSFQAIVLLLFNDISDDEKLSYNQIKEATGLSDPELIRTLQSLACAKYRVLIKHPKGKDVNPTDEFSYNSKFVDAKMHIKINQIQLKETKEENKKINEQADADRHYEAQAAIVRIMKSRKTITHQELVTEVIKATMTRGYLDPKDIKKNIERLIEKDYMERDEDNRYQYVA